MTCLQPCIVSARACKRGGSEGTVTFHFANLLRRSDIELLLCVCWLDKVVLLVHCCVVQISGIQGTPLHPVSCITLQFFTILAMDVEPFDTYPAGAVVNFQRSGGSGGTLARRASFWTRAPPVAFQGVH